MGSASNACATAFGTIFFVILRASKGFLDRQPTCQTSRVPQAHTALFVTNVKYAYNAGRIRVRPRVVLPRQILPLEHWALFERRSYPVSGRDQLLSVCAEQSFELDRSMGQSDTERLLHTEHAGNTLADDDDLLSEAHQRHGKPEHSKEDPLWGPDCSWNNRSLGVVWLHRISFTSSVWGRSLSGLVVLRGRHSSLGVAHPSARHSTCNRGRRSQQIESAPDALVSCHTVRHYWSRLQLDVDILCFRAAIRLFLRSSRWCDGCHYGVLRPGRVSCRSPHRGQLADDLNGLRSRIMLLGCHRLEIDKVVTGGYVMKAFSIEGAFR